MRTLEQIREREARALSAYLTGKTDTHPQGASGARRIIPVQEGKGCWDTAPHAYEFSEWGNLAGVV